MRNYALLCFIEFKMASLKINAIIEYFQFLYSIYHYLAMLFTKSFCQVLNFHSLINQFKDSKNCYTSI
jgi:hypothetical protein